MAIPSNRPPSMRDVRILRPHFDEAAGRVIPPGIVIRVPAPEAESLRISGIGEVMEAHTQRRERAISQPIERR